MRSVAISLLALAPLTGCMTLHADLPEEVVRHHMSEEHDIELAAICSHEGKSFSEGAVACMAKQRMICNPTGRWIKDGSC